jgi:predicted dehydrogenase
MTASRRSFLKSTAALGAAGGLLPCLLAQQRVLGANERPAFGGIGCGGQGRHDQGRVGVEGDIVAVCDVDSKRVEEASDKGKRAVFADYRKLLEKKEIDAVIIGTPDHWHTKIAIESMKAGKDVYCEKPLTLTIDEGKMLCKVVRETKRVFQVGTQQRSEDGLRFQKAVAICRLGRIGKLKKVTAGIGGAPKGGPFKKSDPPPHLNWDQWLGQTPQVDYIDKRCHYEFRWWYEYSGGKMTDWGAHHVDISHWGLGMADSGPVSIEPVKAEHPVELKDGMPTVDDCYNTATAFSIKCVFAGGEELFIQSHSPNGCAFEGEKGTIFVSRGKLTGEAVDALKDDPIPEEELTKLRNGKPARSHMGNFIACLKDRGMPASDVFSHHRALTTCHLANIAIRLGRALKWDPVKEEIVGDPAANGFLAREQRKGYEITA